MEVCDASDCKGGGAGRTKNAPSGPPLAVGLLMNSCDVAPVSFLVVFFVR